MNNHPPCYSTSNPAIAPGQPGFIDLTAWAIGVAAFLGVSSMVGCVVIVVGLLGRWL